MGQNTLLKDCSEDLSFDMQKPIKLSKKIDWLQAVPLVNQKNKLNYITRKVSGQFCLLRKNTKNRKS